MSHKEENRLLQWNIEKVGVDVTQRGKQVIAMKYRESGCWCHAKRKTGYCNEILEKVGVEIMQMGRQVIAMNYGETGCHIFHNPC